MLAALAASPAVAQAAPADTDMVEPIETAKGEIIVTGNRFGGRASPISPNPVDAITRDQLQQSGRGDLIQQLKVEVSIFATPRPLRSGVNAFLQPSSLRELGPG
ncbi:hypothetical protein J2Y58_001279 [Sphingomonas sp. BE138]|uniref:hypothetical protein n=1 Tax=Sphingomonas sp. BE138 TaxID=2817845 RepID=UPI002861C3F7|nr:hypothetical protein [Sphingomonas sp. BE138]MDR6787927.1 hypothetical protein [Sphingomonas sp. BE138]